MSHLVQIGMRVELVSMDRHCHDITLGLYRRSADDGTPLFRVHSYSKHQGAPGRLAQLRRAMALLGAMDERGEDLAFACGDEHALAVRRLFLEACKLDSATTAQARPLAVDDKKCQGQIRLASLGEGRYRVSGQGDENTARRVAAVTSGLAKLAEMQAEGEDGLVFGCAHAHDELLGLLLPRALNVRLTLREQEEQASRGVLSSPSAQES